MSCEWVISAPSSASGAKTVLYPFKTGKALQRPSLLLKMETKFPETFHKLCKAEKGASSQWYDIHSLQNSLGALGGKVIFKGYI